MQSREHKLAMPHVSEDIRARGSVSEMYTSMSKDNYVQCVPKDRHTDV